MNKTLNYIREKFFSSPIDAFLTISISYLIYLTIPPLLDWVFISATFSGESKKECVSGGACWVFVKIWLNRFLYGMYPNDEIWRINLPFAFLVVSIIAYRLLNEKYKKYLFLFLVIPFPILSLMLFSGGSLGLMPVDTREWGGLFLTLVISIFAIIFCFPLGVLLAMGRRSNLPVVRYFSIGFIEFWRGVPLITVLFMAGVMFPLLLPAGTNMDKLVRVIIAITLFEAAYMAEVVRGGLQAVGRGQYDASKAIGMGYWKSHIFIILPQALKLVIPGIANTFIALFKDTPLVFVVGLLEILGMVNLAKTNPAWLGMATEGYVFVALVYWIFCFAMSRYSLSIEEKLKTTH
ncbi:MAG: amino acid ABC transporter permease [Pelagibacteraceae bacterium]|nr:amino acid ABC transporter permease [Pelagibacteraceae bacterium]|tara:strand:- start:165 stop:1211 length:1047 start_codon:yes stop_codon:yes gene_type:complete